MAIAREAGLDFHDSQEITQATFITLARALQRFVIRKQPGSFRSYLRRVVNSRILDHWRARSRRAPEVPMDSLPANEPADENASTAQSGRELAETLLRVLERLRQVSSPRTIQVLHCLYVEDLEPKEAAERLGLSTNAIEQIKSRTRESLRTAWIKETVS